MSFEARLSSPVTACISPKSMTLEEITALSQSLNRLVLYKAEKKVIKFEEGDLVKDASGNLIELTMPMTFKKIQVVFSTFLQGREVEKEVRASLLLKESILSRLKVDVKDASFPKEGDPKIEKFSCELNLDDLKEPMLTVTLPEFTGDDIAYSFAIEEVDITVLEKTPLSLIPYNNLHPEVIAFYHAFVSSYIHTKECSCQDLKFIFDVVIPRLLYARDILVEAYMKNPMKSGELKMSGKKGKDQCSFLFFSKESDHNYRYASVKILPNGQVYFHLTKNLIKGFYKKATFKIASSLTTKEKFAAFAKIAPLAHRRSCKDAAAIKADWEKLMLFKHSNIASIHTIIKERVECSDGEVELIKVYNPVMQDFYEYLAEIERSSLKYKTEKEVMDALSNILRILFGVAEGLQHLHERGYIYQDLKPENILIDRTGAVMCAKLSDFGMLKKEEDLDNSSSSSSDRYKGTASYMIVGAKKSIFSDYYAYGMTVNFIIRHLAKIEERILSSIYLEYHERTQLAFHIRKMAKEINRMALALTLQMVDSVEGKVTYGNCSFVYKEIIESLRRVKGVLNI